MLDRARDPTATRTSERASRAAHEPERDSRPVAVRVPEGDLIVAAGGRQISSADDLFDALGGDGDLEITVVRGADELTVTVTG